MTKRVLAAAGLFLSFSAIAQQGDSSYKGTISDSMCAAKHVAATDKDIACAQKCVKGGSPAVFVIGDKVYKIANQESVKEHIGHKVQIMGVITGDTIRVDSVAM